MPAHILAVVPSPSDLRLIQDFLAADGIEVLPACCLQEALEHPAVSQITVILYDVDAPEPWPQALEQFLRLQPAVRLVFLSRLADERMWADVLDNGGYDLLLKPFRDVEIRSVVRSALNGPSPLAA